jgi:cytochrome c oxidase subunit 3
MQMAVSEFRQRKMSKYKNLITITLVLGCLFIIMQGLAFSQLWISGITLEGSGSAPFMYIIFGLHGLHVLGGIIALIVMFAQAFNARRRSYNPVPVEVISTYWHFVDILWIYLFVFFLFIQ